MNIKGGADVLRKFIKKALSYIMLTAMAVTTAFGGIVPAKKAEAATTPQYRNVMYYGDWSIYAGQKNFFVSKMKGDLITHLNFAFMDVDANGDLVLCDEHADFQNVNDPMQSGITYGDPYAGVIGAMAILRSQYPNMKIGVSVGGWTRTGDLPKLGAQESTRRNFAKNISKFVDYLGFDFVDIDWEYPGDDRDPDPEGNGVQIDKGCKGSSADTVNYTLTLQAIREELDALGSKNNKHYELSIAMSAAPGKMDYIEYDKVLKIVDFANMMTYDLNGAWNGYTGHQTALYTNKDYNPDTQQDGVFSVDTCVQYLKKKYGNSIDYSKIVIGVAPYTRGWKEVKGDAPNANNPGLYASATGENGVTYAYGEIDSLINQYQLTKYWDDVAKANYFYSPTTGYFFTCDTEESVAEKGKYVKENGLGGLISWMASLDSGNSITEVMKKSLYGDSAIPTQDIVVTNPNVSVDVTASGSQYTITIKNNEKANESNAALKDAEAFKESVTYPKLYIKTKSNATFSAGTEAGSVTNENNLGVVDLQSVYAGKVIKQGGSHTFTVKVDGTADINDIESITMTQRILPNLSEFGAFAVYGEGVADIPKQEIPITAETPSGDDNSNNNSGNNNGNANNNTNNSGNNNTNQTGTGSYPAWSGSNVTYNLGDFVSYQDKVYECTYAHSSNEAWTPTAAPTLWKERADLKNIPTIDSDTGNNNGSGESKQTENNYYVNGKLPQHTVTGYWHNFSNGSANLKLADVPTYYDVVCVAFTDNTDIPGEATFSVSEDLQKSIGYTDAQFIDDVKTLKERGQHVLISVGGAEGRIDINSDQAAVKFAESMIDIIEKFGFEGIDIDLEGSTVSGTNYIAASLRTMYEHFGKDFIITMAPETAYMTPGGAGFSSYYWNLAIDIKDILTTVHTQFYNSGGMNGYGGAVANPGNGSFPANLSTLYIESGLRPDQVAIGVPSNQPAASSGQISPEQAAAAFNAMINGTTVDGFTPPKAYPTFRGLMTWSINWDATQDYAWAKAASAAVKAAPVVDNGSTDTPDVAVTGVSVDKTNVTLTEGETVDVKAVITPAGATNKKVTWSSDNGEVAKVNNGEITAVKAGTATITVITEDGNRTATVNVTVNAKNADDGNTEIDLGDHAGNNNEIGSGNNTGNDTEIGTGNSTGNGSGDGIGNDTETGSGNSTGNDKETGSVDHADNDTKIDIDNQTGNGTGNGSDNKEHNNEQTTVAVTGVTVNSQNITINEGNTVSVTATIDPANATNKEVIWTSSNPDVAIVTDGVILARKAGPATITVTTKDGGKQATVEVTVQKKEEADQDSNSENVQESNNGNNAGNNQGNGDEGNNNAGNIPVTGNNGNNNAGSIPVTGNNGNNNTGNNQGISNNGNDNAGNNQGIDNSGSNTQSSVILTTKVTLSDSNIALSEGETKKLIATVEPANATNINVKWSSSRPDLVEVIDGFVTAKAGAAGQVAVIYAEAEDGSGKMAVCAVIVRAKTVDEVSGGDKVQSAVPVTDVTINENEIELKEIELAVNEEKQLSAVVTPLNASDTNIKWISSDPEVVEVSPDGFVTAKKDGKAAILVLTSNEEIATACVVTVEGNKNTDENKQQNPGQDNSSSNPTQQQPSTDDNGKIPQSPVTDYNGATGTQIIVQDQGIKVDTIELSGFSRKIAVGKKIELTADVYPSNANNKTLKWTSSNTNYATVNADGKVSVKKQGRNKTVTITAAATDGSNVKATYKIKIMPKAVKKITLKAASSVTAGQKVTVKAIVSPSKQVNKELKWESNNKKYATVTSKGIVTTKKAGKGKTVKITAKATDGSNKKKTIKIKLK